VVGRICILVVVLVVGPGEALAQGNNKDASSLFKKAEIQFSLGNYKLARDLYKMAHELDPQPSYLINIGRCHHHLEEFDKAVRTFELYLFQEPEADDRKDVQLLIEKSRAAKLRRSARAKPKPGPRPAAPPVDTPPEGPGTTSKVLLWTGVGLTVALVTAGVVTGQLASDRSEAFNDPLTPRDRLRSLKDAGQALSRVSIGTFAAGGATALATVLYYILGYRTAEPAARVAVVPFEAGLALGGAF
jgi:tetratricopeptide (TPR) repeat protein